MTRRRLAPRCRRVPQGRPRPARARARAGPAGSRVRVDEQGGAEPEEDARRGHRARLDQLAVELEGQAGGLVPGEGAGGGAAAAAASSARAASSATSSRSAAASARVPGRDQPGGAGRGDLGEAPDGAEHQRLAEGEAGVEDAGVLGVEVGEDDDVGAAEDRRDLGVLDEAGDEADPAGRLGGELAQRLDVHARVADDPELGALDPAEGLEQGVDPLVGAQQAEEEDHRALGALQLGRQRLLLRQTGEVVEGAVGDDPDPGGVEPDLVAQAAGAVLGVGDDGVHAREDAAGGGELAAARAAAAGCSGRSSPAAAAAAAGGRRGPGRSATGSGRRRRRRCAAEAQHVRDVLGQLEGAPGRGVEAAAALRR